MMSVLPTLGVLTKEVDRTEVPEPVSKRPVDCTMAT